MKAPPKRKKTKKCCPINVYGLLRKWGNGDKRIAGGEIEKQLYIWELGGKVDWRKLGPSFIKRAKMVGARQLREDE